MDFFEIYAIVAMQGDNVTFNACRINKGDIRLQFEKKQRNSPGSAIIKKTAEIFLKYR